MNSQDYKMTAISTGHEGHEVHLCHRCRWPFPNSHPSAKHRRAHKKVCGTIEGYKIVHSEEHDHNLAVSDDEHASDEDEHTPSPKLVKKTAEEFGSSGGVGARSNKSEDDVFSDAVTEFSDSGISPRLEERFESLKERFESLNELDKSMEQKSLEAHLYGSESLNVDATSDTTEQVNDPTRSAEEASVGPITGLQADLVESEILRDNISEYGNGGSLEGQMKDKSASITLKSEEGRISDPAFSADESKEELCEKLVSDMVKHDHTETLQNLDASAEIVGQIALSEETHENNDASVGIKDIGSIGAGAVNTSREESLLSTTSLKRDGQTEQSEAKPVVSSIDIEGKQKTSVAGGEIARNFDANEGEKCDVGGNENRNLEESKDHFSVDTVADNTFACGDDDQNTRVFEKDVYHSEGKSSCKISGTRNEKGEGASAEVQVMLDSTMPSNDSTDLPSSREAADLRESSKAESSSRESWDNGFVKPTEGLDTGNVTEGLQPVVSADLNHDIGDVSDRKYSPTSTLEDPVSPVITEPPNNIHVATNVVGVECVDVAGIMTELKDNSEAVASEGTPEQQKSKVCVSLSTGSELLSKSSPNDENTYIISEGAAGVSESIDAAHVCAKLNNHNGDVENSENPNPRGQEALPMKKKFLDETSPDVEDVGASKSDGMASSAELTSPGDVVTSEKCSVTPSLKEPVPPLDVRKDSHETCAANSVISVDDDVTTGVNSKSLQAEVDEKLTSQKVDVAAMDLSANNSSSRFDSLEGNCGSISDALENDSQTPKATTEAAHPDKSDTFEPPSFMTLVQSGGEGNHKVTAVSEIETVNNNQQRPKSDAPEVGWFPSLTNVLNESEGRKKNEEIIAKVTKWSPVKQHGPLKNLLNEVKSPNTKQVKDDTDESKDDGAGVATTAVVGPKDQKDTQVKDIEQWNSPARYPIEIKKEKKKKGKSFWVPFVCCSSVHRDL